MSPAEATQRLVAAAGDDEAITLATIDVAVSSFPRDRQQLLRESIFAAAVPHWFDAAMLSAAIGVTREHAVSLVKDLASFSFVEPHLPQAAWNIHERFRGHILVFLFREQPQFFQSISDRIGKLLKASEEQSHIIEATYHMIVAEEMTDEDWLHALALQWERDGRLEALQALADILEEHIEAGRLKGRNLGSCLETVATIKRYLQPVARTLSMLEKSLAEFRRFKDRVDQASVLDKLGEMYTALNRYPEALSALRAALAIATRLSDKLVAGPENIAASREKIGEVLLDLGEPKKALEEFRRVLSVYRKLARKKTATSNQRLELGKALGQVARALSILGRDAQAMEAAEEGTEVLRSLVRESSYHPDYNHALAVSLARLGFLLEKGHDRDRVVQVYREELDTLDALRLRYPDDWHFVQNAAVGYANIGQVYRQLERSEDAINAFEMCARLSADLVARDPQNETWVAQDEEARRLLTEIRRSTGPTLET